MICKISWVFFAFSLINISFAQDTDFIDVTRDFVVYKNHEGVPSIYAKLRTFQLLNTDKKVIFMPMAHVSTYSFYAGVDRYLNDDLKTDRSTLILKEGFRFCHNIDSMDLVPLVEETFDGTSFFHEIEKVWNLNFRSYLELKNRNEFYLAKNYKDNVVFKTCKEIALEEKNKKNKKNIFYEQIASAYFLESQKKFHIIKNPESMPVVRSGDISVTRIKDPVERFLISVVRQCIMDSMTTKNLIFPKMEVVGKEKDCDGVRESLKLLASKKSSNDRGHGFFSRDAVLIYMRNQFLILSIMKAMGLDHKINSSITLSESLNRYLWTEEDSKQFNRIIVPWGAAHFFDLTKQLLEIGFKEPKIKLQNLHEHLIKVSSCDEAKSNGFLKQVFVNQLKNECVENDLEALSKSTF